MRGATAMRRLHSSEVTLCVSAASSSTFSATTAREKTDETRPASNPQPTPTPSEAKFSKIYRHESVFAHQASAALNSLFGKSCFSAATTPMDGHEGAAGATGSFATEVLAAHGAPSREVEGRDPLVSHGEEEVLEDRELPAADLTDPEEATVTVSATVKNAVDSEGKENECGAPMPWQRPPRPECSARTTSCLPITHHDHDAAESDALVGAQKPVNLQGARYSGEMASVLQRAAAEHHFVSPFWSSKEAFEQIGASVVVPDTEGVVLPMSSAQEIRVFNLEQTTLADQLRFATQFEMRMYVSSHRNSSNTRTSVLKPMNIVGGQLSRERVNALAAEPRFFFWQERCPYWVTLEEIRALGAVIRPEEEGISCRSLHAAAKVTDSGDCTTPSSMADGCEHQAGVASGEIPVYNLMQLQDDSGRFSRQFRMPPEKLARCYSIRGSRYLPITTWLMWEYCRRYNFPLEEKIIVMLTAERIFSMGGTVVSEPRLALPRGPNFQSEEGFSTSEASTPDDVVAEAKADADLDEVGITAAETSKCAAPPPFTMIVKGEVVTLFNALQTDIPDAIFQHVEQLRRNRVPGRAVWMQ
ncbi:hypothetical protein ABL78_5816 [Leptomonas seymouri]|uniref:Trypanosoma Tc-38 (p38) protein domain-containing protein n=1 Tax=Leptomonas seymouri TaxID=5684 RepID=A0A0N1HUK6_LEPSE|nr:hypothetical protein ABL78_5816 [Leptomonas seymouri]|eukprot:KPI85123.1 hypothetical protein ABL78_5816 [Leptomonas seymouri]